MSSSLERVFEEATDLIQKWSKDSRRVARRKRTKQRFRKIVRALLLMAFVTFVVIPAMIASGFLFGPRGVEGLIAAPVVLLASYAAILFFSFRRTATPKSIVKATIAQLPAQTSDWLEEERHSLPWPAQRQLDSLAQRLEALTPQLQTLDPQTPSAMEVRRLLGEELPELVRGYRKVPAALAQQPLYGGASPEKQLIEGLETIDKQIGRVHEQLAKDDLHALATHQRYLELKYKNESDPPDFDKK
ncbi:MAG: hypothetical protein JWN04_4660 [Myxococcaceae bacterium]|nr:hypothetical protein [Myxococcaceae bacterium]